LWFCNSTGYLHANRLIVNLGRNKITDIGMSQLCDAWERNINLLDIAFILDGNDCKEDTLLRITDLTGVRALAALLVRLQLTGSQPDGGTLSTDVTRLIAVYAFDVKSHPSATMENNNNDNNDDNDGNDNGEHEEEEE
jgi:hypothetical protein